MERASIIRPVDPARKIRAETLATIRRKLDEAETGSSLTQEERRAHFAARGAAKDRG